MRSKKVFSIEMEVGVNYEELPERKLVRAVLESALQDVFSDGKSNAKSGNGLRGKKQRGDALDWIFSNERRGSSLQPYFTFFETCEILGINPFSLRKKVQAKRDRDSGRVYKRSG